MAHDTGIQIDGQPTEFVVELIEREEGSITQPGQHPALNHLNTDLDLRFIAWLSRPGWHDGRAVMLGHLTVGGVDGWLKA